VLGNILYAVGGHDGPLVRKSVESYNPDTGKWSPVADMALCRRNAGSKNYPLRAYLHRVIEILVRNILI
jgi:hypothetical protein